MGEKDTLKYSKATIEQGHYFDSPKGTTQKLVKGKFDYFCELCNEPIMSGQRSLVISTPFKKEGWKRCRICLPCCQEWLEKTHQVIER